MRSLICFLRFLREHVPIDCGNLNREVLSVKYLIFASFVAVSLSV